MSTSSNQGIKKAVHTKQLHTSISYVGANFCCHLAECYKALNLQMKDTTTDMDLDRHTVSNIAHCCL